MSRIVHRLVYNMCWSIAALVASASQVFSGLNTIAAVCFLFLLPYQAAFEVNVAFNGVYVFGYLLDALRST